MSTLVVRPLLPADVEPALAIVAATDASLVAAARADLQQALGEEGPPRFFAADLDGRLAGLMGYGPDPFGVHDVWWAVWLYVHPQARRRGVARALYTELERRLIEQGCRKIYLDVGNEADHQPAIAFHVAHGFRLEGHLSDFWSDGEDFLVFGKRVGGQPPTGPS